MDQNSGQSTQGDWRKEADRAHLAEVKKEFFVFLRFISYLCLFAFIALGIYAFGWFMLIPACIGAAWVLAKAK